MIIRTAKASLVSILVAIFFAASAFPQPVLIPVKSTPYDSQMSRIQHILRYSDRRSNSDLSLLVVNHWMEELRLIPYGFSEIWKTPEEVETSPIADCKGKAVALYERMKSRGASSVRLVIGKRTFASRSTHAWLEWTTANDTYVLDPTINWMAYKADQIGSGAYIPFYAYSGRQKYRVASSTLVARN